MTAAAIRTNDAVGKTPIAINLSENRDTHSCRDVLLIDVAEQGAPPDVEVLRTKPLDGSSLVTVIVTPSNTTPPTHVATA